MKNINVSIGTATLALLGLIAQPALAQVSRTPWEMNQGAVIKVTPQLPSNGALPENGYIAFAQARIPAEGAGWVAAPNPDTIGFGGPKASKISAAGFSCRNAVDYTYFQTFVDVPAGTTVEEFKIAFKGMDDASRITIFNSANQAGTVVEGSYVLRANAGSMAATTDLRDLLVTGRNRVVITQVDWCPVGNQLQSAQVELNGSMVAPVAVAPKPAVGLPASNQKLVLASHGDVHISTNDGLRYDFQADGEYLGMRSTDGEVVVQLRQEMWKTNPKVSVNTAVAMNVAGDRVETYIAPGSMLLINGVATALPTAELALPKGGSISPSPQGGIASFYVQWPNSEFKAVVIHYANGTIDYGNTNDPARTYEGLFGNMDGNPRNDFYVRGIEALPTPPTAENIAIVGESWRVQSTENLFRDGRNVGGKPAAEQLTMADLDPQARDAAKANCTKAGITDPSALSDCTYDVAATGDAGFIESARAFQASVAHIPAKARIEQAPAAPKLAAAAAPSQGVGSGLLLGGEAMMRGSRYSMGGHYLTFQKDGNLCVYRSQGDQFVWCINNDPAVRYGEAASATMLADGRLVVADANGGVIWQAPQANAQPRSKVVLTSDGAFQILSPADAVLWSSR